MALASFCPLRFIFLRIVYLKITEIESHEQKSKFLPSNFNTGIPPPLHSKRIQYWNVKINIFKAKELLHKSATVWNTSKFRKVLLLELFVSALHVPPYTAIAIGNVYGNLHVSSLGVVVFLRLYLVPRMLKQYFKRIFITHKVRLIGAINRVPFNTFFVNKAILNLRPYKLLLR